MPNIPDSANSPKTPQTRDNKPAQSDRRNTSRISLFDYQPDRRAIDAALGRRYD